jgi:hypothetical protein
LPERAAACAAAHGLRAVVRRAGAFAARHPGTVASACIARGVSALQWEISARLRAPARDPDSTARAVAALAAAAALASDAEWVPLVAAPPRSDRAATTRRV